MNQYSESFGATARRGFMNLPIAIRTIIGINTVVFLVQLLAGLFGLGGLLTSIFAFVPSFPEALYQPWRIITYMFFHSTSGIFHYLFNMLWLWWMGKPVEERMGPRSFTVLYMGAGIGGALLDLLIGSFTGIPPVIGASGAVFGVMVGFAMLFPRLPIMLFLLPPVEARYVVAGMIAINVLFLGARDNVSQLVHLGGAFSGYLIMKAYSGGFDLSSVIRPIENFLKAFKPVRKAPKHMRKVEDVEIVEEVEQSELDEILEKISKKGYDGLTKEEKQKLFELSKKN